MNGNKIHKLVVACDAGVGSSVMLASQLRKELSRCRVTVELAPVTSIPADADVVLCHAGLAARARSGAPGMPVVTVQLLLGDPAVTRLVTAIKKGDDVAA